MNRKILFILLLLLPAITFSQFREGMEALASDPHAQHEEYQPLIFEATTYIFNNPVDLSSVEFISATQIVAFWIDKETAMKIPAFGDFFDSLTNENHQQFLYTIAMIHYGLDQKLNNGRVLTCKPIKRRTYGKQDDVMEVQLEGARIFLAYAGDSANQVPLTSETKKYLVQFENGTLEEMFFKD